MTKIKRPSELKTNGTLKVLVYGQPGIGKSTIALSFPSPLMIDCDRGVHRVQPQHLTDTVEVNSYSDVDEVLKENLSTYETIIFDTGGKLLDFMTDHLIKQNPKFAQNDGTFSLKGYGARKALFNNLLSRLHVMNKHVVFVAHEREERDGDVRFVRPEIGGSSGNDLIKELDLVAYMDAVGQRRTIHFNPQEKFYAKNSCGLPAEMKVPDVSQNGGNVFMQKIVERYDEALRDKAAMTQRYESLLAEIAGRAGEATEETINKVMDQLKGLDHIWDSKLRAARMVNEQAKELGMKYNKENEKYEKQ